MSVGLFTVLKSVPWSLVISNAPAVADGAKKLWKAVSNRSSPENVSSSAGVQTPVDYESDELDVVVLRARLAAVEAAASRLDGQMLASSELIKALAEQNTQLIELVEANRVRTLWLSRVTGVLGVVVLGVLVLLFLRPWG